MKFVCYTEWEKLPESADVLFERSGKDSIYFSRTWFESITKAALEDDHSLVLACVQDGEQVMAILPLMESGGNKTWYSLRHGFTPIYSLLIDDDKQQQVLSCLAESLSELNVNGLLLEPVAEDDYNIQAFQKHLETAGYSCEYRFRDYNWIYRLQGQSFDEYMSARPAKLRNTISRKKRKLEREHSYEIRLFTGDEVAGAMPDYYVVYNASWKQNELKNADLLEHFLGRFSKEGWSRLAILYVKEQPVAAQVWFVHSGKASIFRLAYDKAWRKSSVGSILTSFLMEYVIDTDMVEEIDFQTGNDAYKQDWMSERRERFLLSCIKNTRPAGRLERFVESLKSIFKK